MILPTALLFLSLSTLLKASNLVETEEQSLVNITPFAAESESVFELEKMVDMSEEEVTAWLIEKRAEHDAIALMAKSSSTPDLTTSSSGSLTPMDSPLPSSSKTATQNPQDLLASFSDAIRTRDINGAYKLLKRIPDWKMTKNGSNFSALSEISQCARSRFLGKLNPKNALEIFKPLLQGKHMALAGGYLSALALFHHDIQIKVMSRLIGDAPYLKGYLLQASIYFKMDSRVISFILSSGAVINIQEEEHFNITLRGLPYNYLRSRNAEPQMAVTRRFFMNFFEGVTFPSWGSASSPEAEVNFLHGMLESVPEESGAIRAAFENYSPEIVMALVNLSPYPQMVRYHLAHLIAKNPEKQLGYPQIEELVERPMVFFKLIDGQPDLVALAFLSRLEPAEQFEMMSEFLSKTKMFAPSRLAKPTTSPRLTDSEFELTTGIYEFPNNPADIFFLTACKWNIDDAAFAKLYKACININTRAFMIAKRDAMQFSRSNGLDGKIAILSTVTP